MKVKDFESQLKVLSEVREVDLFNKTFIVRESADFVGKHLLVDINILHRILMRDEDALKQKEVKAQITSYYSKLSNKAAKDRKRLKSVENVIELVDDEDQAEEGNSQTTKSTAASK